MPACEVRPHALGRGVFATRAVPAGAVVVRLSAVFDDEPGRYTIQVDERRHQAFTDETDDYLNHSCTPNTRLDGERLCFVAVRDIAVDEEVTFHYGSTEWDMAEPFACRCDGLAREIRGFRHLSDGEQEALAPLVAGWLWARRRWGVGDESGPRTSSEPTMNDIRFRTTIELGGKTATGFEVPADVVAALGSHKRPSVRVTIGGYTYRSTVAVMGGRYLIPLSAENRAGAGVAAGDEVEVGLVLDDAPREVEVPADLAAALDAEPGARARFDGLSYTNRKEIVRSVEEAKAAETRRRRIEKAVTAFTR